MAEERKRAFKLGTFVLAGLVVLVAGLYMLGSKRNMFTRTLTVKAHFNEVNGLRVGDNVRYAGIDVGTVEGIVIENDTVIQVEMQIQDEAAQHIRSNAQARIASDGLMGNKLVSLEPGEGEGGPITDGAELASAPGLDTDAMLRSLSRSNDNVVAITTDLRDLSERLNSDHGLIAMLGDTGVVRDVTAAMVDIRQAASNARSLTERVNGVVRDLQNGKGALGMLTNDTTTEQQVRQLMGNLTDVSDSLTVLAGRIGRFSQGLDRKGSLGHALTHDTVLVTDVKRVVANLDTSSSTLTEDLRALQRNWFFRKYFKEKAKKQTKP